jgi:hypothetical protein
MKTALESIQGWVDVLCKAKDAIRESRELYWRDTSIDIPPMGIDLLVISEGRWFPVWGVRLATGWFVAGDAKALAKPPAYWMPASALPELPEEPE